MGSIGVLALQGGFAAHAAAFADLGVAPREVRRCVELEGLEGLVIPGGESTTLLNLMQDEPWFDSLREFHSRGGSLLGTCAGAILLAREVLDPRQASLGLLDTVIRRNGFGRQIDSFETRLALRGSEESLDAVFIRAPRISSIGGEVEVLAYHGDEPVIIRQGRLLGMAFHPELTDDLRIHQAFLDMAEG